MENLEQKFHNREKYGCCCFDKLQLNLTYQEDKEFFDCTEKQFRYFLIIHRPELYQKTVLKCKCKWHKGHHWFPVETV